ncbi:MAG: M24 family metallopeptidase [Candidatus Puniceispirillaceae bacterium]
MRGFATDEYQNRLARAQQMMATSGQDALFLTTETDVRYFTGFLTRFWESPTRPWYVIIPQSGKPIAVIPSIGAALMARTWIADIRTWSAPDLQDDGLSLLSDTLHEVIGQNAKIGVPFGHETHIRMPHADFLRLQQLCPSLHFADDGEVVRRLRLIKSAAEISKIQTACDIAGRAFDRVGEIAKKGIALSDIFREFQRLCLSEGADWVPYLAGGKGPMGYDDVISPASDAPLLSGEVMMLDTGLVYDGYFCDYDRNYVVGTPSPEIASAWDKLLAATSAGREAARPGNTAADIYHAMDRVLTGGTGGGAAGRLGHGLGMQLTEWPSFIPGDKTELCAGMVITLEPGLTMPDGSVLVHEDDFVLTTDGVRQLSAPAPQKLWTI